MMYENDEENIMPLKDMETIPEFCAWTSISDTERMAVDVRLEDDLASSNYT